MKKNIIRSIFIAFMVICCLDVMLAFNIVPLTLKREIFIYEFGTPISTNPGDYITANESVVKDATLNMAKVKSEIGIYPASIKYNNIEYSFSIKIEDTTKPKVKLKSNTFNYTIGQVIQAQDLIDTVEDQSQVTAYFVEDENDKKETSIEYNETGSYIIMIVVEDAAGNQTAKLRVKLVITKNKQLKPVITGANDIEILKGEKFDPLKDVKATDGNGVDITEHMKILRNNVNVKKTGTYEVIYFVKNTQGNETQLTRVVKVVKEGDHL